MFTIILPNPIIKNIVPITSPNTPKISALMKIKPIVIKGAKIIHIIANIIIAIVLNIPITLIILLVNY